MRQIHWLFAMAIICAVSQTQALAQVGVPFFGGGAAAFDPEVSVVNSGAVLDAQAVVSHDRKYVTINARPTNTALLALRQFPIGSPPSGFVGGVPPVAPAVNTTPDDKGGIMPTVQTSPAGIANAAQPPIVQQRGMTLLKPLDR